MSEAGRIVDVGVHVPAAARSLLLAASLRYRNGRPVTTWAYSPLTDAYTAWDLRRSVARSAADGGCDAVLTIQDLAILPVPYFTYQDLSYDALIAAGHDTDDLAALLAVSAATVRRRRERQLAIYERAAGVIAMSEWFARSLTEQTGLPAEKVHVVHPGASSRDTPAQPRPSLSTRPPPRRRLLFVGHDFYRKGGDTVVAAFSRLRREVDPQLTLTIAGPRRWPLAGSAPDGVDFRGPLPPQEVAQLYDQHDLFVMPSRMEPFGVVFAEAISRGLPCVARDAFAMPEIVIPGETGCLIRSDDADELATAIAAALADDGLYERCAEQASAVAAHFSWQRAGREAVDLITRALDPAS
jgi:glycosyltransferase involved in cell wall biosynthesis